MTKNKGVFTSDTALEKLVYLAYTRIRRKWTMPVNNWGQPTLRSEGRSELVRGLSSREEEGEAKPLSNWILSSETASGCSEKWSMGNWFFEFCINFRGDSVREKPEGLSRSRPENHI